MIPWDGGNNDFLYKPDLMITVADYLPYHEPSYYPGEVNLRTQMVLMNKIDSAAPEHIQRVVNIRVNPGRLSSMPHHRSKWMIQDHPGKRVLVVEDGPPSLMEKRT